MTNMVNYTLEGSTAIVHMDDGKANALSLEMIDGLLGALAKAEAEAKAMVLVGRKDRFCAGFDLRVMMSSPEAAIQMLSRGANLLMKLYGSPIPVVMACTGHALAGGALMLLTGDVRIATLGAYRIGLNEVSIGMPVPILAMELARDRLDPKELTNATLGATIYDPNDAMRAGFVDDILEAEEVLQHAKEAAAKLGEYSRFAYKETKVRLRQKTIDHIISTLDYDTKHIMAGFAGNS